MTTTSKTRRGEGRVKFLAHAEKIKELINSGHAQQFVYDQHADALGISYSQFNRYVSKYVLGKTEGGHQKGKVIKAAPLSVPTPSASDKKEDKTEVKPGKASPFTFNAEAGKKRTDLI